MKSNYDLSSEDLVIDNPGRIAVIASMFNGDVTQELVRCCLNTLKQCGYRKKQVDVYWVPGAWELPQTVKTVTEEKDTSDAAIAIGCIIRGETPHFDYVAGEASNGLGEVARSSEFPVIFGVLTTDTWEQAWERASESGENKGGELAKAALHMIKLFRRIQE